MAKNVILFLLISFIVTNTYCKSTNVKKENGNETTNLRTYAYRIFTFVVVSALSYGAYNIYCFIKERVKRHRQQEEKWEEFERKRQRKKWEEYLNTENEDWENKRRERQQKKWEEYLNTENEDWENKRRERQRKKWEEYLNTENEDWENKRRERQRKKWEEYLNTENEDWENKRRERQQKKWEEYFNTKSKEYLNTENEEWVKRHRQQEEKGEEFFNNGNDYFKHFPTNHEMKEIQKLSDELMERKDFKTINQEVFNNEFADELLKDLSNSEKTHKQAISKFYREIRKNYLSDRKWAQDNKNNQVEQAYTMTFNPLFEALKKHDSPQTTKNTVKRLAVKDNWGWW